MRRLLDGIFVGLGIAAGAFGGPGLWRWKRNLLLDHPWERPIEAWSSVRNVQRSSEAREIEIKLQAAPHAPEEVGICEDIFPRK